MSQYPPVQYHDYLGLDKILNAQNRRSVEFDQPAHDEMLFIITHQTYELWFKQLLHEVDSIINIFAKDKVQEQAMGTAISRLDRVVEIQKVLIDQIGIIETMTPLDFLDFREFLYPASGFQSFQFRVFENKLGLRPDKRIRYNEASYRSYVSPEQAEKLQMIEKQPSLFDGVEKWLERTPFLQVGNFDFWKTYREAVTKMFDGEAAVIKDNPALNPDDVKRNLDNIQNSRTQFEALFDEDKYQEAVSQGHWRLSYKAVHAALFIQLYRHLPGLQFPFKLITTVLNIDELMTTWRYRHALMAKRMIGTKIGTGGSSGYEYLRDATDRHKIFSDFFQLTTFFIPRSALPELPQDIQKKLHFNYEL